MGVFNVLFMITEIKEFLPVAKLPELALLVCPFVRPSVMLDQKDHQESRVSQPRVKCHQAPSSVIKHHQASSSIIKRHQASSSIIKHHQASSSVMKHHKVS